MIKNFNIFNERLINDVILSIENIDNDFINKLKTDMSYIVYKIVKKYKSIRIISIEGYFNVNEIFLFIKMSNKDIIDAKLKRNKNISIKINNKIVYSIDNTFKTNDFYNKIIHVYKNHLINLNYKIK